MGGIMPFEKAMHLKGREYRTTTIALDKDPAQPRIILK